MDKKHLDHFYDDNNEENSVLTITVPIAMIYNSIFNNSEHIPKEYDLTNTEVGTLISLYKNGGRMSPTELYKALVFTSSAISKVLKKLERKKLISREPSDDDKRSMLVVLSDKGAEVSLDCFHRVKLLHEKYFNHLDEKDQNDMRRILKKMVYSL